MKTRNELYKTVLESTSTSEVKAKLLNAMLETLLDIRDLLSASSQGE